MHTKPRPFNEERILSPTNGAEYPHGKKLSQKLSSQHMQK
jgi:hypothetical protein